MKIAYIGTQSGTSAQRADALERLGHDVCIIDPWRSLRAHRIWGSAHWHSGYRAYGLLVHTALVREVRKLAPDLIWVNQGEFIRRQTVRELRGLRVPIVVYVNDNPFAESLRGRFRNFRRAVGEYDLVVVVFAEAVAKAEASGARRVMRVFICADERDHLLSDDLLAEPIDYLCDVAFIGSWIGEHRSSFMADLVRGGVPVSIWGDGWESARDWGLLRDHWQGPGIYDPSRYAARLRSSRICLGLVNSDSGNLHTDRSVQIPALGALLCAPRTSEHLSMYEDGEEAVFFDTSEECISRCNDLLIDPKRAEEIRIKGRARCVTNGLFNERVLSSILEEASSLAL